MTPISSWQSARFGKRVHLTHHAVERMVRRDLTLDMIKELIENGEVRCKDEEHWWIFKAFPDRSDNLICAAVMSRQALIVKTLMTHWEEREQ